MTGVSADVSLSVKRRAGFGIHAHAHRNIRHSSTFKLTVQSLRGLSHRIVILTPIRILLPVFSVLRSVELIYINNIHIYLVSVMLGTITISSPHLRVIMHVSATLAQRVLRLTSLLVHPSPLLLPNLR